jgi:ATP-binding protein involved in chromosome partitioning
VVPVASGKGGVGKSTVAVNLALGLAAKGLKVGLLDLDLYGPSLPLMMGQIGTQPEASEEFLEPIVAHGIKTMSLGFLVDPERALIWRGPIIMKAVRQLLHDVAWAPLDVLVLDLPPGTGDVQITMAQEVPITGAVIVTTPQDVALIDAIKAVDMFRATETPVLGIVENMSYFVCDGCDKRHEIFGHGSVAPLAQRLGVEFLGELPLDPKVRELADQGRPAVESSPQAGQAYAKLADKVWAGLEKAVEGK